MKPVSNRLPAEDLSCNLDLATARKAFDASVTATWQRLKEPDLGFWLARDAIALDGNDTLVTDIVCFGQTATGDNSRGLIVISSGVHGIEGYAGALLQRRLLCEAGHLEAVLEHADVVFIHAVNPWGMHHRQRTDKDNVDLNRNAHDDPQRYLQVNELVPRLRDIISPQRPAAGLSVPSALVFRMKVAGAFLRHGVRKSAAAVMHGQYEYPQDLFYGGKQLSAHLAAIGSSVVALLRKSRSSFYAAMDQGLHPPSFVIDLHTGLGPRGELTLMMAKAAPVAKTLAAPPWTANLRCHFEDRRKPVSPGIFCEWLWATIDGARQHQGAGGSPSPSPWQTIVFELGTLGDGLPADIEALHRLVLNNQLRHHGMTVGDEQGAALIRERFVDLFAPDDPSWWRTIATARFADLSQLALGMASGAASGSGSGSGSR